MALKKILLQFIPRLVKKLNILPGLLREYFIKEKLTVIVLEYTLKFAHKNLIK